MPRFFPNRSLPTCSRRLPLLLSVSLALALLLGCSEALLAAEIDQCRELLRTGKYAECVEATTAAIERGVFGEAWHLVKSDAETAQGHYEEAHATITKALERYSWSVRLRWAGVRAARFVGETEQAETFQQEIAKLVQASPWRYTDADNLVTLGQFALAHGADAKDVQDAFYRRARRNSPVHRAPMQALAELALDKRDSQLAAELFREALEQYPDDPDAHYGLGLALHSASTKEAAVEIARCLELNPNHIPALLWQTDRALEAEQYDDVEQLLGRALEINSRHPEALAFRATLAYLQGREEDAVAHRAAALSTWKENPEVDHIIGREHSQKYRFAEGAEFQRQALEFDPDYLPARKQLAQDLLRLGDETTGWQLAGEVYEADQYDVAIYNLVTLRDEMQSMTTLESEGFVVRMDPHEAALYGDRVLQLLGEARETLTRKYGVTLPQATLVEIFPHPNDFAVRTFGMPGAAGFLGVCFGNVITANSPASQSQNPANWQAVLWHEFAHVVTLNATNNRMPRWLSEGISVYEERQRNSSWGERMDPTYRQMILSDNLTPVGDLSGAFLSPPSPLHLQFAYYESSLVVEYIIDEYGFEALLAVLEDLGNGLEINETLSRRTVPIAQLEDEFANYARQRAMEYGAAADWSRTNIADLLNDDLADARLVAWAQDHPTNYEGLKLYGRYLMQQDAWEDARRILEQALELVPDESSSDSPLALLPRVYRQLGDREAERDTLIEWVRVDDSAFAAHLRLIELDSEAGHWESVREQALAALAINPLIRDPHAGLAEAASQLKMPSDAIDAYRALLKLEPPNPADVHFRLAEQLLDAGETATGKRHLLQALEEAPRFRAALTRLLEVSSESEGAAAGF